MAGLPGPRLTVWPGIFFERNSILAASFTNHRSLVIGRHADFFSDGDNEMSSELKDISLNGVGLEPVDGEVVKPILS